MNAISQVLSLVKQPAQTLVADYLRSLALAGRGCPSNPASIAHVLGISLSSARRARDDLVSSGRLEASWQVYRAIDGLRFGEPVDGGEIDAVKTILRRHYRCVVDRRTVQNRHEVADGPPTELLIDGRIMSWECAVILAKRLAESDR